MTPQTCPPAGPGPSPAQGHPSGHLPGRWSRPQERPDGPCGGRRGVPSLRTLPGDWTALSGRLMRSARCRCSPSSARGRALSERRQRGASGVRHFSGKDGQAGSLREMSKHCGYPASDSPGTREGELPPHPGRQARLPRSAPGPARPGLGREPAVPGGAARRRGAPGVAAGSVTQAVAPGAGCGGLYWPVTHLSSSAGDRAGAGRWGGGSTKAR